MKKYTALILALMTTFLLCACGGNSALEESLCEGMWLYQFKGVNWITGNGNACFITEAYSFNLNGTFEYIYNIVDESDDYDESDLEPSVASGTYKIDEKEGFIQLRFKNDSSRNESIPFYLKEYNHEIVINADDEGNSEWEHTSVKGEIDFVW